MKTLIIYAFLFLTSFHLSSAQACNQISKGNLFVGGSSTFRYDKSTIEPTSSLQSTRYQKNFTSHFDIRAGFFVLEGLGIGLTTNLIYKTWKQYYDDMPQISKGNYHLLYIGPIIRYSSKWDIFIEGYSSIGISSESLDGADFSKGNEYLFGLGLGYNLFLTESVAFEPKILYLYSSRPHGNEISKSFMNGVQIEFGFQIYLKTKSINLTPTSQ